MTITRTDRSGTITVKIEGWLDIDSTPQFHEYQEKLENTASLIFDFENLEYISSSGVREIVAAYRRQKASGGTFAVINASPEVFQVFRMTGLDRKISITEKGD